MNYWNSILWAAAGSALPVLVRTFFAAAMRDFVRRFIFTMTGVCVFDRTIGRLLTDPVWSGRWRVTWHVSSSTFKQENACEGRLYRCFDTVVAEGIGHTVNGESVPYGFIGKLSRGRTILTGTWFDRRGAKTGYHGSYQIRVPASGRMVTGKWIGFSDKEPVVKCGELTWERLGD